MICLMRLLLAFPGSLAVPAGDAEARGREANVADPIALLVDFHDMRLVAGRELGLRQMGGLDTGT